MTVRGYEQRCFARDAAYAVSGATIRKQLRAISGFGTTKSSVSAAGAAAAAATTIATVAATLTATAESDL